MILRPDEQANQAYIERDRNIRSGVGSTIKTAGGLALGAGTAKVLPLLSEYIPTDLAIKGLSKVSPKIADFLKRGQSFGLDLRKGMEYVKDQITPKDDRNIIQKYDDQLHEFMQRVIKKGLNPTQAVTLAWGNPKFKESIQKIVDDNKTPFLNIVEQIYGSQESVGKKPSMMQEEMQRFQQGYGDQSQQNAPVQQPLQQPNQGQQALMAIMQRINQKLGG